MFRLIRKYSRIWWRLSVLAASNVLFFWFDSLAYLFGKIVRLVMFFLFILAIFNFTDTLGGYGRYEVIIFFLTFNLVDVIAQALFRGAYLFSYDVTRGNFDFILTKPVNALFYIQSRLTDILDAIFVVGPILGLTVWAIAKLPIALTPGVVIAYILLLIMGVLVVLGIHVLSVCFTIWSEESNMFIWLYREAMTFGRFPPNIFPAGIRWVFTYLMPVMIAVAVPSRALLGRLTPGDLLSAVFGVTVFLGGSLWLWQISLRHYSSASS